MSLELKIKRLLEPHLNPTQIENTCIAFRGVENMAQRKVNKYRSRGLRLFLDEGIKFRENPLVGIQMFLDHVYSEINAIPFGFKFNMPDVDLREIYDDILCRSGFCDVAVGAIYYVLGDEQRRLGEYLWKNHPEVQQHLAHCKDPGAWQRVLEARQTLAESIAIDFYERYHLQAAAPYGNITSNVQQMFLSMGVLVQIDIYDDFKRRKEFAKEQEKLGEHIPDWFYSIS